MWPVTRWCDSACHRARDGRRSLARSPLGLRRSPMRTARRTDGGGPLSPTAPRPVTAAWSCGRADTATVTQAGVEHAEQDAEHRVRHEEVGDAGAGQRG